MASFETELYWSSFFAEAMIISDQILLAPFLFCTMFYPTAFHFSILLLVKDALILLMDSADLSMDEEWVSSVNLRRILF